MNYSTAIFLINDAARAVRVTYEGFDEKGKPLGSLTTFKTFDPGHKVGDFVIVPTGTRVGMTVCQVAETEVDVDPASPVELDWIVSTMDRAAYDAIVREEQTGIVAIKSAEKRRQREELVASLIKDNPDLAALQSVGQDVALPAPPAPKAD